MKNSLAVLIVEDSESDTQLMVRLLKKAGYEIFYRRVETAAQMSAALAEQTWDIVVSDYNLPQFNGRAALELLQESQMNTPFILVSGAIGEESAAAIMKAGAHDYLMKENLLRLSPAIKRELAQAEIRQERKQAEQKLRESEERYRTLVEQAVEGIFIVNAEGRYLAVNSALCKIMGYACNEILQLKMCDITWNSHPKTLHKMELQSGKTLYGEHKLIRKDGSLIDVEISARQLPGGNVQGIMRDISERKQAEEKIRKLSSAVTHSPAAIIITAIDGRIEYVNPKFTAITGYSMEEALGKTPRILKSGQTPPEVYTDLWQTILAGREWRGELLNRKKNGELYWDLSSISAITDADGNITHFVAVNEDITQRKENESKIARLNIGLEQLAITDYLTNLHNRRYFMQRGAEEFKRAKRNRQALTLLMLDIDEFKKVNDTYGHEAGDMALQQVAATLKFSLREVDILGRMGGEEFAVLFPNTALPEGMSLAERVRENIAHTPFEVQNNPPITITVSIGVSSITEEMTNIDDMLRSADAALYHAKHDGRNRVMKCQ